MNLFYDGCIIGEIRDFRRHGPSPEIRHVLLQASTQTLVADLNSICNSGHYIWTQEDKYSLESQLLLATQPTLCLDPSPRVAIARSHVVGQSSRAFTADRRLKRFAMRYTESYRRRALARCHDYSLPYPFRIAKLRRHAQMQQQQHHLGAAAVAAATAAACCPTNYNSHNFVAAAAATAAASSQHNPTATTRVSGLLANAFSSTQVCYSRFC